MTKAIFLMAHGAPGSLDEVPEYVLHIRHGRPLQPELMSEIVSRYRQVGGSPLLKWTLRQAELLEERLGQKVYVGMRHSQPFIQQVVQKMISDGVDSVVAICMAPQFSRLTIGAYQKALDDAIAAVNEPFPYKLIGSYARHPQLIQAFHLRLETARQERPGAFVLFTAHSLPQRVLQEGDSYDYEVKETARFVARAERLTDWKFAYQSQGLTDEKWLGPNVESRIDELASKGCTEILVQPIGFVCDHVEILYDIDISFREYALKKGIVLNRVTSLNDSPQFIGLLQTLVSEQL